MASFSASCAGLLGISEPSARFLLALFSAHPFAFVYRRAIAKQSSSVQNVYFTLTGAWVVYYVYGFAVWHSVVDILAVYLVLRWCGGTLLSLWLTWAVSMGHLVMGYAYIVYTHQIHAISWTIPHCVLVLKLIGLAYNLYDGKKPPDKLNKEFKSLAISKIPSFFEVTGFCYFYGSVLAGPQIPFSRHSSFTEGRLFDWDKTPSSVPAGLQRLAVGIFFAMLYSFLNQYFPISILIADEFVEKPFYMRLLLLFICGKVALWRYISVWLIAEGACMITGISYNRQEGGGVDWRALDNIHIIKFETCVTLEDVIGSFNLNTNKWVAWYIYKRLRFLGNKQVSWALSMLFIIVWHGLWPGYFLNFSLEMMLIMAERSFISFLRRLFGCSLSELSVPARVPLTLLAYVCKNVILMYPVACFMFLQWSDCYKFMSSVYFFCHLAPVLWFLLHHTLLASLFHTKKTANKTE